jgi:hypothetical protein
VCGAYYKDIRDQYSGYQEARGRVEALDRENPPFAKGAKDGLPKFFVERDNRN